MTLKKVLRSGVGTTPPCANNREYWALLETCYPERRKVKERRSVMLFSLLIGAVFGLGGGVLLGGGAFFLDSQLILLGIIFLITGIALAVLGLPIMDKKVRI